MEKEIKEILEKIKEKNKFLATVLAPDMFDSKEIKKLKKEAILKYTSHESLNSVFYYYIHNEKLKGSQASATLANFLHTETEYLNANYEKIEWIRTESDAGGLKVGNEDFSIIVPNGYGDCTMKFAIIDEKSDVDISMNYFTMIEGNFKVASEDTSDFFDIEIPKGRYHIYYYYKTVLFVKIK